MVMTDKDLNGTVLDDFLAAARADMPEPSEAFLARVLADAEAVQAGFQAAIPVSRAAPRGGFLSGLSAVFGGWAGLSGMATATIAGLWIGFAGADQLGTVAASYIGGTDTLGTVNLLPDGDFFALAAE
jgi:hypothetical protein